MQVRSLALRTDLAYVRWLGAVDDLGDVVRAHLPASPDYFFGNFLLFPDAPQAGDLERWIARFAEAFAHDPNIRHVCLRWDRADGEGGDVAAFAAAGFVADHAQALIARATQPPPRPATGFVCRPIDGEADWAKVRALQVAVSIESFGPACVAWANDMVSGYRRLVEAGHGRWFGAFDGRGPAAPLAADLGVFVDGGVGRFRSVETASAYRRRGLCGTLVHHASQTAFHEFDAETLVLVADPDYHAGRIYESVGFQPAERLVAVFRRPG
jgi:predicted GNAT family N-acyltransferase